MNPFGGIDWSIIGSNVITYGGRLLLIFIVFLVAHYAVLAALSRVERHLNILLIQKSDVPGEVEKRMKTIFGVFRKASMLLIWIVALLTVMNTLGLEIGPVIATAGVFGLAVSFGAQSLVKDVISGIFILFENQIRIGDVAVINGRSGLVEEINLRTVVLRDLEGTVHIFPNGNITELSNRTKDWSAAVMEINVAYKEDPDRVMNVLREAAAEMRLDPVFGDKIIADVEIFGVQAIGDCSVSIRVRIKTKPSEQWAVGREYRRRVKLAFDAAGISIPFPHRTLEIKSGAEVTGRHPDSANGTAVSQADPS